MRVDPSTEDAPAHEKLGQWLATSICGNDITSSCFYCTGLVVVEAGVWAPLCMALVALTLYLFRSIYGEAVTALPLNGGAYNVLLNTTSKSTASLAACLTILSYVATGVVSAGSAAAYLQQLWADTPVTSIVIALLALFALLTLMGITDSARAALFIFSVHLTTLTILLVTSIVHVCRHGVDPLIANYHNVLQPQFGRALYFGFASAMLGVTGFETSANFVEEQKEGVFVLTLRNMWSICSFFNPSLALLTVMVVNTTDIQSNSDASLAILGLHAGGTWLQKLVAADAVMVLSGSILTAYVGVTGLCRRLAGDRCMPQFLLAENSWRHTNHYIILGFFGLCSSLYLILRGNVETLSNVYTVSFLGVMSLFAVGDMILKYKRNDLPRPVRASWPAVLCGFALVITGFSGTIVNNPSILVVWLMYFVGTGLLMSTMFFRVQVLKFVHYFGRRVCSVLGIDAGHHFLNRMLAYIAATIQSINAQPVAFFAKRSTLSVLNKAILYVRQNEDCAWIRIIHCYEDENQIPANLHENVRIIDCMYPKIKVDLILVKAPFCPDTVKQLSESLDIPRNLMFLTCPKEGFNYKVSNLGGLRLITH